MRIGVPAETRPHERRVALVPDGVAKLTKAGCSVLVQRGAGTGAYLPDADFEAAGATIVGSAAEAFAADLVLKVQRPTAEEAALLREGAALVSFLAPAASADLLGALAGRKVTAFAMELVPRTTKAQSMDALSSQATIAGYKAVLVGADAMGRILPMLTTAAGTLAPAKVFVIGAGVAGLQAIATARRLGGIVSAFDVRAGGARAGAEPRRQFRRGGRRRGRGAGRLREGTGGGAAAPRGGRHRRSTPRDRT